MTHRPWQHEGVTRLVGWSFLAATALLGCSSAANGQSRPMSASRLLIAGCIAASLARTATAGADEVVQIPIDSLLDGRPVTTWTAGQIVTWTVGVDDTDGLMTAAAEAQLNETGVALPDDGVFPADARHPDIVLHFSNAAPASAPQAHSVVMATGQFDIPVTPGAYTSVFLIFTSSYGASALGFTLTYADGSTSTVNVTVPDWAMGAPANDPVLFDLIGGMQKWTAQNQEIDTPNHTLTGVQLSPAAGKALSSIQVNKPGATTVLLFWGATGVASSLGDAGAPAMDAASADAAADVAAAGDASTSTAEAGGGEGDGGDVVDSGRSAEGSLPTDAGQAGDDAASWSGDVAHPGGCSLARSPTHGSDAWWLAFVLAGVTVRRRGMGPRRSRVS
jgi:hypothetical protein